MSYPVVVLDIPVIERIVTRQILAVIPPLEVHPDQVRHHPAEVDYQCWDEDVQESY